MGWNQKLPSNLCKIRFVKFTNQVSELRDPVLGRRIPIRGLVFFLWPFFWVNPFWGRPPPPMGHAHHERETAPPSALLCSAGQGTALIADSRRARSVHAGGTMGYNNLLRRLPRRERPTARKAFGCPTAGAGRATRATETRSVRRSFMEGGMGQRHGERDMECPCNHDVPWCSSFWTAPLFDKQIELISFQFQFSRILVQTFWESRLTMFKKRCFVWAAVGLVKMVLVKFEMKTEPTVHPCVCTWGS